MSQVKQIQTGTAGGCDGTEDTTVLYSNIFLHVLLPVEHQLHICLSAGTQWKNKKITGQHALFLQNLTEDCTIIPSIHQKLTFQILTGIFSV